MRILLAILEAGGGHRSAARSVQAALLERSASLATEIEDVGAGAPLPFVGDPPAAYRLFLDSPVRPAFEVAWHYFDRLTAARALIAGAYPFLRAHVEAIVAEYEPDLIVGVHAGVAQVFGRLRRDRGHRYRVATVVTDIVSVHALWSAPAADLCLVPTTEAYRAVVRDGVPARLVRRTGFPIHPEFARVAARVGPPPPTAPDRPRVLLMGGGAGAGGLAAMLAGLEQMRRPLAIEVVTGNNPALYDRLKAASYRHEVTVHGFVTDMAHLMGRCDIVVTKAGPGSLMEAFALRRPALVGAAVGPQEVGNLDWGQRRGLAWPAGGPARVAASLTALLENWPEAIAGMQPVETDGAHRIADALLELL